MLGQFFKGGREISIGEWQKVALARAFVRDSNIVILDENGESVFRIYQLDGLDVMRFTGRADYYLWPDRIICHPSESLSPAELEIYLMGTVLAYALERRKIPALHAAAAAVVGHSAVAFITGNYGGKSGLAASLVQGGYRLLTDDLLPVESVDGRFYGRPGYPAMRMWPDEAAHFIGQYEHLELVHPDLDKRRVPVGSGGFGIFCPTPQPLAAIYLVDRRPEEDTNQDIVFTPLNQVEALMAIAGQSFLYYVVERLGWQRWRIPFFAGLVRSVPVRRLTYPSGMDGLPRVRDAVLRDISRR